MKNAVWILPFLAASLSASTLSGRWAGVIEISTGGTTMTQSVRAEFEQKANGVIGHIGRQGEDHGEAIRNGRVEGKRVLFEVSSPDTEGAFKFELTMEDDRLEGSMKGALDSGPISGKVHLARAAGK